MNITSAICAATADSEPRVACSTSRQAQPKAAQIAAKPARHATGEPKIPQSAATIGTVHQPGPNVITANASDNRRNFTTDRTRYRGLRVRRDATLALSRSAGVRGKSTWSSWPLLHFESLSV